MKLQTGDFVLEKVEFETPSNLKLIISEFNNSTIISNLRPTDFLLNPSKFELLQSEVLTKWEDII